MFETFSSLSREVFNKSLHLYCSTAYMPVGGSCVLFWVISPQYNSEYFTKKAYYELVVLFIIIIV